MNSKSGIEELTGNCRRLIYVTFVLFHYFIVSCNNLLPQFSEIYYCHHTSPIGSTHGKEHNTSFKTTFSIINCFAIIEPFFKLLYLATLFEL